MSIRDRRWVTTAQLFFAVATSAWIADFAAQEHHSSQSWVTLILSIVVLVGSISLVLHDIWKRRA